MRICSAICSRMDLSREQKIAHDIGIGLHYLLTYGVSSKNSGPRVSACEPAPARP